MKIDFFVEMFPIIFGSFFIGIISIYYMHFKVNKNLFDLFFKFYAPYDFNKYKQQMMNAGKKPYALYVANIGIGTAVILSLISIVINLVLV